MRQRWNVISRYEEEEEEETKTKWRVIFIANYLFHFDFLLFHYFFFFSFLLSVPLYHLRHWKILLKVENCFFSRISFSSYSMFLIIFSILFRFVSLFVEMARDSAVGRERVLIVPGTLNLENSTNQHSGAPPTDLNQQILEVKKQWNLNWNENRVHLQQFSPNVSWFVVVELLRIMNKWKKKIPYEKYEWLTISVFIILQFIYELMRHWRQFNGVLATLFSLSVAVVEWKKRCFFSFFLSIEIRFGKDAWLNTNNFRF